MQPTPAVLFKHILWIVFCTILNHPIWSQDQGIIDSLEKDLISKASDDTLRIRTLVELWRKTSNNSPEKAAQYARAMIRESKSMDYATGLATGDQRLGIVQDIQGHMDSAAMNYHKALLIYQQKKWSRLQGIMLFNISTLFQKRGLFDSTDYYLLLADSCFARGNLYKERSAVNQSRASIARELGENDVSIEFARKAYELASLAGDSSRMADAEQEIGFGYQALGEYQTAADYFRRGADFFQQNDDLYYATISLLNLATCLDELGQEEEAITIAQDALQLTIDQQFAGLELDVREVIGHLHREQKRYEQAEKQFQLAYQSSKEQDLLRLQAKFLSYLSEVQIHLNKFTVAKQNGMAALALSTKQGQNKLSHLNYASLAKIANHERDYKVANEYLLLGQAMQDSLHNKKMNDKVAELTLLFEKEKQDRLISDQRNKLSLLEAQTKVDRLQNRNLLFGLLALGSLFAALAFSLWQRNRRQQLEKKQLACKVAEQQQELSAHALQMAQKSQFLGQLEEELRQIKGERTDDRKKIDGLLRYLDSEGRVDQDWNNFQKYFRGVHGNFEERLKTAAAQSLSNREVRLAALIKMQLNNQEISTILGVSQDSLYKAKYRLRKKIPRAAEAELNIYLKQL